MAFSNPADGRMITTSQLSTERDKAGFPDIPTMTHGIPPVSKFVY
jgi:hypothetical protein